jgi:hypothetical protein
LGPLISFGDWPDCKLDFREPFGIYNLLHCQLFRIGAEVSEHESEASPWIDWRRRWRDPITLFTLFLVVVGALQWFTLEKTDETLKLQQRAWLTPLTASLFKNPEKDAGISFFVLFNNSGREPATGVRLRIRNSTIDSYDGRFVNMVDIVLSKNDTCEGLLPDPGRSVVAPTTMGTGIGISENSIHGDPRFVADDRILRGERFYVVMGCAAYLTQQKVRYSSFCYILYSEIPAQTPEQKAAQPPQVPSRTFQLANCAAGFDAT